MEMLRKIARGLVVLLVAGMAGLSAQPATAATERPVADVTILPRAHVTDGGASITVRLLVRCRPVDGVQWEGFVNVTQGDVFAWAGLPLVCDGRLHMAHVVLPVSAPPDTAWFTPGGAEVSAVIMDENTLVEYANDARSVRVVAMCRRGS